MIKLLTIDGINQLKAKESYIDGRTFVFIEQIIGIEAGRLFNMIENEELIKIRNKMVRYFDTLRPDQNSHMPLEAMTNCQ